MTKSLLDFNKKEMKTGLSNNKYKIKVNNNTLIDILILKGKKGKDLPTTLFYKLKVHVFCRVRF